MSSLRKVSEPKISSTLYVSIYALNSDNLLTIPLKFSEIEFKNFLLFKFENNGLHCLALKNGSNYSEL